MKTDAAQMTRALLFVRNRSEDLSRPAVAAFQRAPWPTDCEPCVVDVDDDPETARWFGISAVPTVAVVRDGVLLAVEVGDCSPSTCARVLDAARIRRTELWRRSV